jgi:hypothetical protein
MILLAFVAFRQIAIPVTVPYAYIMLAEISIANNRRSMWGYTSRDVVALDRLQAPDTATYLENSTERAQMFARHFEDR